MFDLGRPWLSMTLALCYEDLLSVRLGDHLLLAMHLLRHGEVGQEVHEGLTRSSYLRLWSALVTLVVCPNFTNKKKSRNCMKSPAWKGGGHAWHCQLPGGWTGSTRSIGWNCSRCTLRGYSHPDTLVITFHVRLASAGDIVFNLPEEIIGNPDRSCTLLLIPSGMQSSLSQSLQSTLLLSSRAAWSLRVSVLVFQVKLGTHRVIE